MKEVMVFSAEIETTDCYEEEMLMGISVFFSFTCKRAKKEGGRVPAGKRSLTLF